MVALSITHLVSHLVIFAAYLMAIVLVVPVFSALIKLSIWTRLSGAGFFLFCGITHAGLSVGAVDSSIVAVTDHLQAASIVAFIVFLGRDLAGANQRLNTAFSQIGNDAAVSVAAALQDVRR